MSIQGLSEYGGFYNQYRVNQIPQVDVKQVEEQASQLGHVTNQPQNATDVAATQETQRSNASRIANLEDVSLSFLKDDTFDYIGSDREIGNLDIQKAVSDMKKDQVLQEYQYFVGSNIESMISESADGKVLQKLNF